MEAQPAGVLGMHHVAIICSSREVIHEFYGGVLGLSLVHEAYRSERDSWKIDMALPDGSLLELFTFPGAPARPSRPEAKGLRHLSLRTADLDASAAAIAAHAIEIEPVRVDEYTGSRFTFFSDPDGLPIELYEIQPETR